jgi:hypothetical protein
VPREDERVEEVRLRFMEIGRALVFSKTPDGFTALFPWRDIAQPSAPPHAYGRTRAEAAENAWAEFERLRDGRRL